MESYHQFPHIFHSLYPLPQPVSYPCALPLSWRALTSVSRARVIITLSFCKAWETMNVFKDNVTFCANVFRFSICVEKKPSETKLRNRDELLITRTRAFCTLFSSCDTTRASCVPSSATWISESWRFPVSSRFFDRVGEPCTARRIYSPGAWAPKPPVFSPRRGITAA